MTPVPLSLLALLPCFPVYTSPPCQLTFFSGGCNMLEQVNLVSTDVLGKGRRKSVLLFHGLQSRLFINFPVMIGCICEVCCDMFDTCPMRVYQWPTHPEGVYDHILGLQLSLQDTEESQQLCPAQSLHVHLLILKRQRE